jgi:hypothetical protein
LETFTGIKPFVDDPRYGERRRKSLGGLDMGTIDRPIADLIGDLARLPYCFTLQSCCGHFLYDGQGDPGSTEPLPDTDRITTVEYRLAYVALCIEDSEPGRALFADLARVPSIDPSYVQWGCAEWFWNTDPNSYVLQVEPARQMNKDRASVPYKEALHLEATRDRFFTALREIVRGRTGTS